MITKRRVILGVVTATLVLLAGWWMVEATEPLATDVTVAALPPTLPEPIAPSTDPVAAAEPNADTTKPAPPASARVAPQPQPVIALPFSQPPPAAPLVEQDAAWLPPSRTDKVFDLNGNGRVEADEQERAGELLERSHQFASNRSPDGVYPMLKATFRGEGKLFRAIDADADGALTEREFLAFEADSIRQLRRFDQNADGALTLNEFGHLKSRFDYLDEDHDGELYAWEITLMRGRGKW